MTGRGPAGGEDERTILRGFRSRFLIRFAFVLAFGTLLLLAVLFTVFSRPFAGGYDRVFLVLRHLGSHVLPAVVLAVLSYVLLVCGATAFLVVHATHRIAGPLYRMERALDGRLAGEPVTPVFFRNGDQGAALAEAFNGFMGRLQEDRGTWLGIMEQAERLCLQDAATCRAEMNRALDRLAEHLARYR